MSPIRSFRRLRRKGAASSSVLGLMVLELAAIVAAVVLGFVVNDWREGRARARVAERALASLAQEMSDNHRRIARTYEYYSRIHGSIREHLQQQAAVPASERRPVYGYELPGWQGAMPPMLRSSTWQMMISTGTVADLPFEQADTLAQVYNLQSMLERLDGAMVDQFAQDTAFTDIRTIGHLFGVYVEILPALIGSYQTQGRPILAAYGYDLEIESETLRSEAHWQVTGVRLEAETAEASEVEER